MKPIIELFCTVADVVIFVIDSSDKDGLCDVKKELHDLMLDESFENKEIVLLIFANKQDLHGVFNEAELIDKLHLCKLKQTIWYVQSCAVTGDGVFEGFNWLTKQREKL